jgi:hypothetical protein
MEEILKSSGFRLIQSTCLDGKVVKTWTKTIKSNRYEVKVYPLKNSFAIFHQEKSFTSGTETELLQRLTNYKLI